MMRDREPLPTPQSISCSASTSQSTFVVWPKWKVEYPTVSITKTSGSSQASGQVRSGSSGFTSRMSQTPNSSMLRTHTMRISQLVKVVTARRFIQKLEKKCCKSLPTSSRVQSCLTISNTTTSRRNSGFKKWYKSRSSASDRWRESQSAIRSSKRNLSTLKTQKPSRKSKSLGQQLSSSQWFGKRKSEKP